ncbi:hypothetical protein EG346_24465 [Chryseobacterium carnipullorum]|uniref:DUF2569 domain-containing protein n=1 Tax=Chryseobacterium carnipullorum TaxID=1124835 RepID=A0A1M7LIE6_CHRCU|nr:hypothetical protein [Chryseobacterium carnipullorum]AZA51132.1 hypothetical protein EG346_24465 [Chryseobacterium carnipullorum]AZA65988.1 hypothetical protein EG345_15575 [Chryseobacterium carnipullorum]SHM77247.1 hypothetical protein SAMN05444360_11756 [Chryseobacterium carnipullorum]STD04629.1 Uncharacterised protein [Chryseobacterium carnipullorum]
MSRRKFILLSILKTWFIATIISTVILMVYMMITEVPNKQTRTCDMSGLAYSLLIMWILSLGIVSFSSLFSLLKVFHGKIKRGLCWFLLPILTAGYFFIAISEGKIDGEGVIYFLISNLPWFLLWGFYYSRFNFLFKSSLTTPYNR